MNRESACALPRFIFWLQQNNLVFFTDFSHILRPQACLYLADMGAVSQQHAETGLSDTAADGVRKLAVKQHLMVRKVLSILAAGLL